MVLLYQKGGDCKTKIDFDITNKCKDYFEITFWSLSQSFITKSKPRTLKYSYKPFLHEGIDTMRIGINTLGIFQGLFLRSRTGIKTRFDTKTFCQPMFRYWYRNILVNFQIIF